MFRIPKFYFTFRKAKTFIPKVYQAIPPHMELKLKDPFDYKLRSKEEVMEDFKNNPPDFELKLTVKEMTMAYNESVKDRNRKVKLFIYVKTNIILY